MLKPDYESISPDLGHSYKYESYDIDSPNNNKLTCKKNNSRMVFSTINACKPSSYLNNNPP